MDIKNLISLSKEIDAITYKSISEVNSIIENELKIIAEKYNLLPEQMILISKPNEEHSIIQYEIGVKVSGFTIEHNINITGTPKDDNR